MREADLDRSNPLPQAPWFEPGASWSVRRVALHLLAEISQHAGHADIIRESIDGKGSYELNDLAEGKEPVDWQAASSEG